MKLDRHTREPLRPTVCSMRAWVLAVAIVAGVRPVGAQAPPSLAEIAAKEQERRQHVEAPSKVYTDANLASVKGTVAETQRRLEVTARKLESEPTTPSSPVLTQSEAAEKVLAPVLDAIQSQVRRVESDFRRYLDACYQRFTHANSSGLSFGSGTAWTWNRYVDFAWEETWVGGSSVDNSTTAYCRALWSDIEANGKSAMGAVREVSEIGRRAGVLPGVMRGLFAKYGLTEWAS